MSCRLEPNTNSYKKNSSNQSWTGAVQVLRLIFFIASIYSRHQKWFLPLFNSTFPASRGFYNLYLYVLKFTSTKSSGHKKRPLLQKSPKTIIKFYILCHLKRYHFSLFVITTWVGMKLVVPLATPFIYCNFALHKNPPKFSFSDDSHLKILSI